MRSIHVLRKPCSEPTVAANVLRYGTGAVNIDGTRVATSTGDEVSTHSRSFEASKKENRPVYGVYGPTITAQTDGQKLGRWPANLVLQHLDGCVQDGVKKVGRGDAKLVSRPRGTSWRTLEGREGNMSGDGGGTKAIDSYGTETVAAWTCAPGCPVAGLDEQSGPTGSWSPRHRPSGEMKQGELFGTRREGSHYGDFGGGASRFFKQVKP